MNIILLVIDTLRYDHVGANGNTRILTPALDRLSASSWTFDRAFSGSYPTIPMRKDLITGLYGAPFFLWSPLPHGSATLLDHLHGAGYVSQLIHDTPHLISGGHNFDFPFMARMSINGAEVDHPWITDEYVMLDNWSFDPTFDQFMDRDLVGITEAYKCLKAYIPANHTRKSLADWNAAKLFDTASRFLQDNKRRDNFFLWVDCFDPHEPWDAPPEYVRMYDKADGSDGTIDPRVFPMERLEPDLCADHIDRINAHYAAKVTFMDSRLERFLETLAETGLDRKTAVILTADHGTNIGDGHYSRFGKGASPLQNEAHVPLMISMPGGGTGRSNAIVQPQDLFATILEIAGIPVPTDEIDGVGLLDTARDGGAGERRIALTGLAVDLWPNRRDDEIGALFCASTQEWNLGVHPDIKKCVLERIGEPNKDVAAKHPDVVRNLRRSAIEEMVRRGLADGPAEWLESGGRGVLDPAGCRRSDAHANPVGYESHWMKMYRRMD
jgi:arylsulfatase A-like enzyme